MYVSRSNKKTVSEDESTEFGMVYFLVRVLKLLPRLFMMEWPFRTFTGTMRGFCIKSLERERERERENEPITLVSTSLKCL